MKKKIIINSWDSYSKDKINKMIDMMCWKWDGNVEQRASDFYNTLKNLVNSMVTKKEINVKTTMIRPDDELNEIKMKLKHARERNYYSPNQSTINELNSLSRMYKNKLRRMKNNEVQRKMKVFRNDPMKLWRIVKNMYESRNDEIQRIKFDDVYEKDPKLIAQKLNDHFLNSIDDIIEKI